MVRGRDALPALQKDGQLRATSKPLCGYSAFKAHLPQETAGGAAEVAHTIALARQGFIQICHPCGQGRWWGRESIVTICETTLLSSPHIPAMYTTNKGNRMFGTKHDEIETIIQSHDPLQRLVSDGDTLG